MKRSLASIIISMLIAQCSNDVSEPSYSSSPSKVKTTVAQPKTTVSSVNKKSNLNPEINSVEELIPNVIKNLGEVVDSEYIRWDEIHNSDKDCENSSLNSCTTEDPFTKELFRKAESNTNKMMVINVFMKQIVFFDYFLDNPEHLDEIIEWDAKNNNVTLLKIGDLDIREDTSPNTLLNFSFEIDELRQSVAEITQGLYCDSTSNHMSWAIHNVVIDVNFKRNLWLNLGMTPGATWSYCSTDTEYPPDD